MKHRRSKEFLFSLFAKSTVCTFLESFKVLLTTVLTLQLFPPHFLNCSELCSKHRNSTCSRKRRLEDGECETIEKMCLVHLQFSSESKEAVEKQRKNWRGNDNVWKSPYGATGCAFEKHYYLSAAVRSLYTVT